MGISLSEYVERNIIDPLTEQRHRLLRETGACLEKLPKDVDSTVSTQVHLSTTVYPQVAQSLIKLRELSTEKLDMAPLIWAPDELYIADSEWAGAAYMEEQKRKTEEEREKSSAESPDKNAADYIPSTVQSPQENAVRAFQLETPEALAYAFEYSARALIELGQGDRKSQIDSSDAMEIDADDREEKKTIVDSKEPPEDPAMRKVRLNLLALAKRAPLDTITRLPVEFVPQHIRNIVPTIDSTT